MIAYPGLDNIFLLKFGPNTILISASSKRAYVVFGCQPSCSQKLTAALKLSVLLYPKFFQVCLYNLPGIDIFLKYSSTTSIVESVEPVSHTQIASHIATAVSIERRIIADSFLIIVK